jgi:hypothetical protein
LADAAPAHRIERIICDRVVCDRAVRDRVI